MTDLVIIAIVVLIVALSAGYIIKAKRRGVKCIGCPDCSGCRKNSCGNCGSYNKD